MSNSEYFYHSATAKSLQSCPTLCDPVDSSPPGSRIVNTCRGNDAKGIHPHVAYSPILCHQFSSVTQSCPTLCDPMNHSTPGLPVHHQHPEFTQTHVHEKAISLNLCNILNPLLSPSPPALNRSQHWGLFQ